MDKSCCFSKALAAKGLAQKGNKIKGGKMSKQRITAAFLVNAEGRKVDKPNSDMMKQKAEMFSIS